jgi:hypothetical protein
LAQPRSNWSSGRRLVEGPDRIVYGLGPLWVVKADGSILTVVRDQPLFAQLLIDVFSSPG